MFFHITPWKQRIFAGIHEEIFKSSNYMWLKLKGNIEVRGSMFEGRRSTPTDCDHRTSRLEPRSSKNSIHDSPVTGFTGSPTRSFGDDSFYRTIVLSHCFCRHSRGNKQESRSNKLNLSLNLNLSFGQSRLLLVPPRREKEKLEARREKLDFCRRGFSNF